MLCVTFNGRNEVRDEIHTTLVLVLHLSPSVFYILFHGNHGIVTANKPSCNHAENSDDDDSNQNVLFHNKLIFSYQLLVFTFRSEASSCSTAG